MRWITGDLEVVLKTGREMEGGKSANRIES